MNYITKKELNDFLNTDFSELDENKVNYFFDNIKFLALDNQYEKILKFSGKIKEMLENHDFSLMSKIYLQHIVIKTIEKGNYKVLNNLIEENHFDKYLKSSFNEYDVYFHKTLINLNDDKFKSLEIILKSEINIPTNIKKEMMVSFCKSDSKACLLNLLDTYTPDANDAYEAACESINSDHLKCMGMVLDHIPYQEFITALIYKSIDPLKNGSDRMLDLCIEKINKTFKSPDDLSLSFTLAIKHGHFKIADKLLDYSKIDALFDTFNPELENLKNDIEFQNNIKRYIRPSMLKSNSKSIDDVLKHLKNDELLVFNDIKNTINKKSGLTKRLKIK